jgi:hypothetical protein
MIAKTGSGCVEIYYSFYEYIVFRPRSHENKSF